MNFFQLTMQIVSAFIMIYFLLIMIRVFLSWIPDNTKASLPIRNFVIRITDPYMRRFRNISWLRFGMLDFSPVLGLIILSFVLYITQSLSVGHFPRIGEIIIWIIQVIWNIVAFFATMLAIIMVFRLITFYTMSSRPEWLKRLDNFLLPKVAKIIGIFTAKTLSYTMALSLSAILLLSLRILIGVLLRRYLYPILQVL